jgi:hypothetical protein
MLKYSAEKESANAGKESTKSMKELPENIRKDTQA